MWLTVGIQWRSISRSQSYLPQFDQRLAHRKHSVCVYYKYQWHNHHHSLSVSNLLPYYSNLHSATGIYMKRKYHVLYAPKLWMVLSSTEDAFLDLLNRPWSDLGFNSTLFSLLNKASLQWGQEKKAVFSPHTNKQKTVFHVSINYLHLFWNNNILLHISFCASPSRIVWFQFNYYNLIFVLLKSSM